MCCSSVLAFVLFAATAVAQTESSSARTVELSGALAGPSPGFGSLQVRSFLFAPGEHVFYLADQDVPDQVDLYCVSIHGREAPVKVNGPLADNSGVLQPVLSPDGERVAYRCRQQGDTRVALYEGPLDGSTPALARTSS